MRSILCILHWIEYTQFSILNLRLTVSKVSDSRRVLGTMAETISQALLKTTTAREPDGAIMSRFEALEKAIEIQNDRHARTDESVRELIETFKLMASNNPMQPSTSGAPTTEMNFRYRHGNQSHYTGMTRLTKVDFPRFDGQNVKEWLFKVIHRWI